MKQESKSPRLAARAALLSLLALAPLAMAQQQTGNLFGKVTDDGGQPLPGVSVSLTGVGAPQNAVTNASGEYRFVNVSPGTYTVRHELSGFSAVTRPNVVVTVGKNTDLPISMRLSNVEAAVTVDGGAPLLDTRKISTGASISQLELQSIPTARDPWVVLSSVPGVLMDRANVGGNESGQQSSYVAKGSSGNASTWNVDGVNVTDVGAVGSSPTYYDFDSFQEMQAATGGSDITLMTAGANLNMVTKRGSNDTRGSGRVFVTDKRFQSDTNNDEATAQGFSRGNRIDDIQDFGLEAGGAIVKDRLWLWGSYGRNQINLRTPATAANPDGFSDKTTLEDLNFKLNAQLMDSNSATLFYLRGDKIKLGRNADITRPQETTWDQKGPTSVYKIEDSHIFSANVFATALYSHIDSGFSFTPQGGPNPYAYRSPDGVNHGTYYFYNSVRPQR
ncbi:MAG: carboxypeptidase regulatory-like domain-containing protein, partial [Acidobacteria bacterium]|nr:carboxypeptidase regulatory-like domain-containing protein [Acidobacteriota bacterium]